MSPEVLAALEKMLDDIVGQRFNFLGVHLGEEVPDDVWNDEPREQWSIERRIADVEWRTNLAREAVAKGAPLLTEQIVKDSWMCKERDHWLDQARLAAEAKGEQLSDHKLRLNAGKLARNDREQRGLSTRGFGATMFYEQHKPEKK